MMENILNHINNMNNANTSISQVLDPTTCLELRELLKTLTQADFEAHNTTRDAYFKKMLTPHCMPKPYVGTQGIAKWIVTIILATFLIFGLIGNILSATIMYRRSRRGLSSYFYLALLAIMDICVLYSGCLLFMLEITFGYYLQLQGKFYCLLGFYFQHLFTYMSAWLIVAVTFERFIVVRFPFQSILICRMHVAYAITLIIFIFFSLYTAHGFFTVKLEEIYLQTDYGYHPHYYICDLFVARNILSFLDLCFYSLIPSLLIIIFNSLIISTMFYAIKQRRNFLQANSFLPTTETNPRKLNQKNKSSSSIRTPFFRSRSIESTPAGRSFSPPGRIYHNGLNKNNYQKKSQQLPFDSTSATGIRLTCLLLIISFIFVFCTLPISIRTLFAPSIPESKTTINWQIIQLCVTLLMYFNHAANFVFYCLTGRAFRNECRKILCGLWALKDIHISCTLNPDPDKHHCYHQQQMIVTDRNRMIISQQQQQQQQLHMKRSYL